MKVKIPAHEKARSDRELELLFRRASEYLKMHRPRLKKSSPASIRRTSAA
jgi:hypothetical protein